ncbi:MAG TPA: peptide deformylase [Elusimicrobiales bacterium]|nr:peptide deformylase [Elusimicrobiales bacterium]
MAVKRILKYGEDVLMRKTKPVNFAEIKAHLPNILKDMWDSCIAAKGAGLSANQIGLDLRLIVVVFTEEEVEKRFVFMNPKIIDKSGEVIEPEGCLSIPGICWKVKRYESVKVSALNAKGLPVEINAKGLFARILQHEIDHLNGKTFIDKLSPLHKIKLKPAIKKLRPYWQKTDESKGKFYEGPVFSDS